MSLLFSTTIRESNIPKYKELREYLKQNNQSIGDYLINTYNQQQQSYGLDEVKNWGKTDG